MAMQYAGSLPSKALRFTHLSIMRERFGATKTTISSEQEVHTSPLALARMATYPVRLDTPQAVLRKWQSGSQPNQIACCHVMIFEDQCQPAGALGSNDRGCLRQLEHDCWRWPLLCQM